MSFQGDMAQQYNFYRTQCTCQDLYFALSQRFNKKITFCHTNHSDHIVASRYKRLLRCNLYPKAVEYFQVILCSNEAFLILYL